MKQDEILQMLRESEALLSGHFELRSGLHSDQFFQCANVLRYPDKAEALCRELAGVVRRAVPDLQVDAVISPALGGIIVGHELARALGTASIFAEKENGNLVLRRFGVCEGGSYVVAEDVITRGGRVQETIDLVLQHGGHVAAVGVLVDRSGGKANFSFPTFSLLQMEPTTWPPEDCPLCADGVPVVHPGS